MGNRRGTKRTIIAIVICLAVAALAITVFHKPSITQYEDDFGFSLGKISAKTLDHYHHDDFRDSLTIYRVNVTGNIEGSIFDKNKMADGLSESAGVLFGEAAELTEEKQGFEDLREMDPHSLKSMELEAVNNTDAQLYIIYYGEDNHYLVIWNG